MRKHLWAIAAATAFASIGTHAQVTAFPEGAALLAPQALHAAISGKDFAVSPAQGPAWRLRFKADGSFYLSAGNYSDSGQWSIKESTMCQQTLKITGCNEVRQKDGVLYMQRGSGEVVSLQPK